MSWESSLSSGVTRKRLLKAALVRLMKKADGGKSEKDGSVVKLEESTVNGRVS